MWGNCSSTLCTRIERLQNRAGRAILKVPVRTSSQLIRERLDWKSLSDLRYEHLCVLVYKCVAGFVPQYLQATFSSVKNYHSYETRSSTQGNMALNLKPRTEAGRRTFLFRGAKAWNALDAQLKTPLPVSAATFKSLYRTTLT